MSDITVSVTAQPAITVGVTPAGATGPQGPVGPSAVSADDGNIAVLGSDDLIYVPESGGGGAVDSVAGKTGVVVLEKADVGLGNVDNTADADKPVSTATATALAGKSATGHTHAQSDVTGLTTALAGKSDVGHTHAQSDVTGLVAALAGKSDTGHTHTASNVTDFNTAADARVVAGITGKLDTSAAPELIRDTIGTALVAGTNITLTVNDAGDTITVADTVSPIAAGSANNPHTTQGAARNSALPKNFWQYTGTEGVDDPTNAILGDEWISA
jgi:hypothetical protein